MREAELTRLYLTELKHRHVLIHKMVASDYGTAGLPDAIGVYKGLSLAFEFKRIPTYTSTPRYSPIQHHTLEEFVKHGAFTAGILYIDSMRLWCRETFCYQEGKVSITRRSEPLKLSLAVDNLIDYIKLRLELMES